ncbi:MAG: tagaturonate epimerase family protein [Phycisphaerae bacterium]
MEIAKFSMGIGDRFGRQGKAQLAAFILAAQKGAEIIPVWNKSNREHLIVHSEPGEVRIEADAAVKALGWKHSYHVDADHIGIKTVDRFIAPSDFFTIDVADFIGKPADDSAIAGLVQDLRKLCGEPAIAHLSSPMNIDEAAITRVGKKYLAAVQEAGRVFQHIAKAKGADRCIIEVSMDETDSPQTPDELLLILAAIAREGIPIQTIAPKFTGRFNKGVDYVGNMEQFEKEFNDDLAVIAYCVKEFGLPKNLKLSVHSGSDKFSIYQPIRRAIKKHNAGLHIKTAGTTWLVEIGAVAEADEAGLALVREMYVEALKRFDELCGPYASVIDIKRERLPSVETMNHCTGAGIAAAIRHEPHSPKFNSDLRQLLHVGYKLASERKDRFNALLDKHAAFVGKHVTYNLFNRHIEKLFC